jgi:hypothetical protein
MCGIFGMAIPTYSGFIQQDVEALVGNMNINMFRGSDSTGLVQVNKDGDYNFYKVVGGPKAATESPRWEGFKAALYKDTKVAFGHGRAATRGKVNVKNAHPFQVYVDDKDKSQGEIILVHNGTLTNHQQLDGFHQHDVDSEWLAKKIVELGPVEALGRIYGAVAAIWYDTRDKKLYFYRNDDRPLHFVKTAGGFMYWNSEKCALMWMKYRYGLQYEADDVKQFEPGKLYSMPVDNVGTLDIREVPRLYPTYVPNSGTTYGTANRDVGNASAAWDRWNHISNLDRNYEEDIRQVYLGTFNSVTFIGEEKRKTVIGRETNGYTSTEFCKPYMPGLVSITFDEHKGLVRVQYADGAFQEIIPKNTTLRIPGTSIEPAKAKYDYAAPVQDLLKAGKKIQFTTKLYNEKHEHRARIDKYTIHGMDSYWNDVDGQFWVGQHVYLSIVKADNDRVGLSSLRVAGMLADRDTTEQFIEFYFFAPSVKGEYEGVYEATISLLTFCDKEEFAVDRCYVKAMVKDVKFMGKHGEVTLSKKADVIDLKPTVVMLEGEDTIVPEVY